MNPITEQETQFAAALATLTPRQREVLERAALGETAKQAGLVLGVTDRAIELHRCSAMKKLECKNLVEVAARLARHQCRQEFMAHFEPAPGRDVILRWIDVHPR